MNRKSIYILSLGCPKNLVDSEVLSALLSRSGLHITDRPDRADTIVVNTCAFILPAREESIEEILRMAAWKKKGRCRSLVVAGCLPQRYGAELARELPEVDLFLGTGDFPEILAHLKRLDEGKKKGPLLRVGDPSFLMAATTPRTVSTAFYGYLKIAEGCSNCCAYCVIPSIRGPFRSRPMADVVAEAERLAAEGSRELILIAQDTTAWGRDLRGRPTLNGLLKRLCAVEGPRWIRLLYAYPKNITAELLSTMAAEEKVCRYLDIPVQHISDRILRSMNRKGTSAFIRKKIAEIREVVPDIALRTSLIVGFPGETEEQFEGLLRFVQETRFESLGVFTYSPEEGTEAARMPGQVPEEEKVRRQSLIMEAQSAISDEINLGRTGAVEEVLIEGKTDRADFSFWGRTRFQAPEIDGITYVRAKKLAPGDIVRCTITAAALYDLYAEKADD
ncbi:MAG TPA: 30S ribosomal protein S12 methylthiotransferase RimO [Syntrophales bacterium]|nr:30S ribosomal protein S12 methylthiotransferase RimO [Syntrophales bacterium]